MKRFASRREFGFPEPALLWVDPPEIAKGAHGLPIVLRYPDGSVARGRGAFIAGACEVVFRPEGYPDGKHVAIETHADVELER